MITRTHRRRWTRFACCAAALGAVSSSLLAGPLDPPVGPVAPTHKTLTEVEPRTAINATNTPGDADSQFKITQPGSYYLAGNITGEVGKHGIEIASHGVTLDLNGFDLAGVPAMGSFDGVTSTVPGAINVAVINGSVRGWGDDGVDLLTVSALNCRVEGVLSASNAGNGINAGAGSVVVRCGVYFNGSVGIQVAGDSVITDCVSHRSGGTGIIAGSGSTVINCTSYLNSGLGISASSGTLVADCSVTSNSSDGILCGARSVIRNNVCYLNGNGAGSGAGIRTVLSGSRFEGNTCSGADTGMDIDGTNNIIIGNTCSGNTVDWTIAANNVVGPIIDRRVPASAAVNGFSAPSSLGTTDPNANFSY